MPLSDSHSRAACLCQSIVDASAQLQRQFRKNVVLEAHFKRQKLESLDSQLQAAERLARVSDDLSSVARPASLRRSKSSPSVLASVGSTVSFPRRKNNVAAGEMPVLEHLRNEGISRSRFGAAAPVSSHPSAHPGACSSPSAGVPCGTRSRAKLASPRHKQAGLDPNNHLREDSLPAVHPTRVIHESMYSSLAEVSTSAATSPAAGRSEPGSPVQRAQHHDCDPFGTLSALPNDPEDMLLAAIDAATIENAGVSANKHCEEDSPETIERLGELMALLGPRYKLLPREKLFERAASQSTVLQRRIQARGLRPPSPAIRRSIKSPDPELQCTDGSDPDGPVRARWLAARAQGMNRLRIS